MAVTRSVLCFGLILVFFMLQRGVFGHGTTSNEILQNTLDIVKLKLGSMELKLEKVVDKLERNDCKLKLEKVVDKLEKMDSKLETVKQGLQQVQQRMNELRSTGCQAPFVLLDGRCYLFSNITKSWSDAQAYCRSKYANLATITSQRENDMIVSYVRSKFPVSFSWWLGGNDMAQEGRWVWVGTKSVMTYTNWYPRQPDDSGGREDCLHLWQNYAHRWNDEWCGFAKNFICEQ